MSLKKSSPEWDRICRKEFGQNKKVKVTKGLVSVLNQQPKLSVSSESQEALDT